MAKVILGMTMSLDGFINDQSGSVDALYPVSIPCEILSPCGKPYKTPARW